MSAINRMQRLRDKRRAAGLVKLELWIKPEWRERILAFIEYIKKSS